MTLGIQPRPHQVQALTKLLAAFAIHDPAQLVMACGTVRVVAVVPSPPPGRAS